MAREMYPSNGRTPMVPGVINNVFCTIFSPLSSILKMSFFVFSSDWRPAFLLFPFSSLPNSKPDGFLPFHLLTFFYFNVTFFFLFPNPYSWFQETFSDLVSVFQDNCSAWIVGLVNVSILHHTSRKPRAEGQVKSDLSIIRVKQCRSSDGNGSKTFTLFYSWWCGWRRRLRIPYFVFVVKP
ncbi:hypothetical protein E4T43_00194 [Aureobasidium subglaciale]|nr:hypothetical protein E4T43_00194 [Aureobasidium subglaciale]